MDIWGTVNSSGEVSLKGPSIDRRRRRVGQVEAFSRVQRLKAIFTDISVLRGTEFQSRTLQGNDNVVLGWEARRQSSWLSGSRRGK